jgi:hypothetical protein
MNGTGVFIVTFYLLPMLVGFGVALRKNIALYLALTVGTLFFSWVLIALYVTMLFGFLLPWVLLCYTVFGMKRSEVD